MIRLLTWNNPVLQRELLDRLRSSRTLLAMLAIALGSCALVQLRWPSDSRVDIVSQGALEVFRPLCFGLTAAVMFFVPAFPATSIVSERRRGTLALLLNSPLSPLQIYIGKWLSNVTLAMIFVSVSLPALSACYAMGGISLRSNIFPFLLVLLGMAMQYSSLGLWISVRASHSDSSLRLTYAAVLAIAVLSLGPLAFIGRLDGLLGWFAQLCTSLSPISALQQITGSQSRVVELGITTGWREFLGTAVVVTLLLAIGTMRKLDPILLDRVRPTGKLTLTSNQKANWLRRLMFLVDPNKQKNGIPLWINPVMIKEFRTRKFGRLHWLIRMVAAGTIVSLTLTVMSAMGAVTWGVQRIASAMVLLQVAMLMLLGPSLGASLIAGEIESGGWQILRTTPMPYWRILTGKFMSVVWTVLLLMLATLPGYVVMGYIVPVMVGQVNSVLVSLLFVALTIISVSACISSFVRASAVATIFSYSVLIALFAGTMVVWLARGKPFGPLFVERVLLWNPVAAALSEIRTPGFESYHLTPTSWWISSCISLLSIIILCIRTWYLSKPD
jgi:ABC-type transport system involved in multi-copper enzyme maturation permease subunit